MPRLVDTSPADQPERREESPRTRLLSFARALHPSGAADHVRVVAGGGCSAGSDKAADVVVLDLASASSQRPTPIDAIIDQALAGLAPGGVLYLVGPPNPRRLALRSLRRRGFDVGRSILHLTSGAAHFYAPLTAKSLAFATRRWPLARRWALIALLLRVLPGSDRALRSRLANVGVAAHAPGATGFDWLLSRLPDMRGSEALVATSWRRAEGSIIIFAFGADELEPSLVAKRPPQTKLPASRHEAAMLEEVARKAGEAGVGVPRLVDFVTSASAPYLLETGVSGRPACEILKRRPEDLGDILEKIVQWLQSWHRSSIANAPLTAADCDEMILAPARALLEGMPRGPEYYSWLEAAAAELVGVEVPWVNAHNDLSMVNLLLGDDGAIAVVDWETASTRGLPLADYWYAACDAATCGKPRMRAATFNQCFIDDGGLKELVASHEQRLRAAVGGPEKWIRLCFHACWLQHAANEKADNLPGQPSPFRAIANALPSFALAH